MCSKKWANPDLPGSTSLREPVCTGIWSETMLGNPVGTTMTFSPLGSLFSAALNGRMSLDDTFVAAPGLSAASLVGVFFWAIAIIGAKASRIAARQRNRFMKSPLGGVGCPFYLYEQTGEVRSAAAVAARPAQLQKTLDFARVSSTVFTVFLFARRTRAFFL